MPDVEVNAVQGADGLVGCLLHPRAQRLRPVQRSRRVGVEDRDSVVDAGTRPRDLRSDRFLLRDDTRELGEPPRVGFVEVHGRSEEVPRRERIPFAPDRVDGRGLRRQLVAQERREHRIRVARCDGTVLELLADHRAGRRVVEDEVDGALAHEGREERARRVSELVRLLDALLDLPDGSDVAARRGVPQRLHIPGHRLREGVEPCRDVLPVLQRVLGGDVEHVAHLLQR